MGIKMKFRIKVASLSVVAAAVLAACGGGGGGGTASTTSFPGTVIDGYIEGATVCLDLNADQACDTTNDRVTTSKVGGTYSLDTTGLTMAQIKAAHLLTFVPLTAKDADDNGKTLAEAGKAAFNLMAPASAFMSADGTTLSSAVISPLTTLVSHDMISGNGKALADSEASVRTRMGLAAGTDLRQDFVAKNDTALIQQARVVAAAIGEVKKAALAVSGTSDRDALLAALNYLQQNVAALQTEAATAVGTSVMDKVKAALATPALKPAPETLIVEAEKITHTSTVDM